MTSAPPLTIAARESWLIDVGGVVQGVGFRPFVHRLARRFGFMGHVRNVGANVEILLEGDAREVPAFVRAVRAEAPPLAVITWIETTPTAARGSRDFLVVDSEQRDIVRPLISPDVAPCADCERELDDPNDRRAGYPFVTCTNCGPRHSVIVDLPYDRERTSMRPFRQCPECEREYHDLDNRRYRSETNSCPACGPSVRLLSATGEAISSGSAITEAAKVLGAGGTVAVRGVGGFHLAVDATSESAVSRLRQRKRRDGKPLAVMVRSLHDATLLASISDVEAARLVSQQRPIVVLEAREGAALAPSVSDGLASVGIMLPGSPLHMLLLDAVGRPLVMTSGNPSDVPLAFTLEAALETLADVADAFLTHDREIVVPIDDSVLRVVDGSTVMMRRARGYAPLPVPLPVRARKPILAVGAYLKNTFTLVDGEDAFVSPHVGDLETLETIDHWNRSLESLARMLGIRPTVVARDLHPDYASTRLAERQRCESTVVVQHHHAHVAAVAAEHGCTEPLIGVAFDGTGLGTDGAIWGAEFMVADLRSFGRMGHLRYAPLPGGDRGAREGWRAALGYAHVAGKRGDVIAKVLGDIDSGALRLVRQQCEKGLNAPPASSMGRLFDAAAAILGVCTVSRYEGEAAMRLERAAGDRDAAAVPLPISADTPWTLDPTFLLAELACRTADGDDPALLAAVFHESVAEASAALVVRIAEAERLNVVALGGGVFQNARLLSSLRRRLTACGLRVLTSRQLPPNDGAISYGQAVVAAARTNACDEWESTLSLGAGRGRVSRTDV